jgi:polyphenol oxidase
MESTELREKNQVKYWQSKLLEDTGLVKHCFTTRIGGVSKGVYNSLNLGLKKLDRREAVLKNYEIIANTIGIDVKNMVLSDQIHLDKVKYVDSKDKGKGIFYESDIVGYDGLMTDHRGIALVTFYADCVPLFFLDTKNNCIAMSHAGWKGTVLKIAQNTLNEMNTRFNTNPDECIVAIGPSIGQCCFEVGKEVLGVFQEKFSNWQEFCKLKENDKAYIDLKLCNRLQLEEAGVLSVNIDISKECTCCKKDIYFSHRGDKGNTGSLCGIMELI